MLLAPGAVPASTRKPVASPPEGFACHAMRDECAADRSSQPNRRARRCQSLDGERDLGRNRARPELVGRTHAHEVGASRQRRADDAKGVADTESAGDVARAGTRAGVNQVGGGSVTAVGRRPGKGDNRAADHRGHANGSARHLCLSEQRRAKQRIGREERRHPDREQRNTSKHRGSSPFWKSWPISLSCGLLPSGSLRLKRRPLRTPSVLYSQNRAPCVACRP